MEKMAKPLSLCPLSDVIYQTNQLDIVEKGTHNPTLVGQFVQFSIEINNFLL
jgi:hypothetical protein